MAKVISDKIYSPQVFVEMLTDKCYCFDEEDTVEEIRSLLKQNGIDYVHVFSLLDAEKMISTPNAFFVVVDTSYLSDVPDAEGHFEMTNEYRFIQVPNNLVYRFV